MRHDITENKGCDRSSLTLSPWSKMGEMAIKNKQIPLSLLNCFELNRCIVMREILSKGSLEAVQKTVAF